VVSHDYSSYEVQRAPAWLRGPFGAGWLEAHGLIKDGLVEGARQATKARFVSVAPSDALPYAASDRGLERMPHDTEATWRARLGQAWELWAWAGTRKGVVDALERTAIASSVAIYDAHQWNAGTGSWARFWVVLQTDFGPPPICGAPGLSVGQPDLLCGLTGATSVQINAILRAVRLWRPPHAFCEAIILKLGEAHLCGEGALCGAPGLVVGGFVAVMHPDT